MQLTFAKSLPFCISLFKQILLIPKGFALVKEKQMCVHVIQTHEKRIWVCTLAFFLQIEDSDRKKGLNFMAICDPPFS